jgi:hypothetical protein
MSIKSGVRRREYNRRTKESEERIGEREYKE